MQYGAKSPPMGHQQQQQHQQQLPGPAGGAGAGVNSSLGVYSGPNAASGGPSAAAGPGASVGQETEPIIVLQCLQCKQIFGDTTSFVGSIPELGMIVLYRVSNVRVKTEEEFVKTGYDRGCAFQRLVCTGCETHVGKIYRTSFPFLTFALNAYSFHQDLLFSYQIGTGQFADTQGVNGISEFMERLHATEHNVSHMRDQINELQVNMTKAMELLLSLNEEVNGEPDEGSAPAEMKRNVEQNYKLKQIEDGETSSSPERVSHSSTTTTSHKGSKSGTATTRNTSASAPNSNQKSSKKRRKSASGSDTSSLAALSPSTHKRKQIRPELIGPARTSNT